MIRQEEIDEAAAKFQMRQWITNLKNDKGWKEEINRVAKDLKYRVNKDFILGAALGYVFGAYQEPSDFIVNEQRATSYLRRRAF